MATGTSTEKYRQSQGDTAVLPLSPVSGSSLEAALRGRQAVPVAEAAKWLSTGKSTLNDAIRRGDVPVIRLAKNATRVPAWWLRQQLAPPSVAV